MKKKLTTLFLSHRYFPHHRFIFLLGGLFMLLSCTNKEEPLIRIERAANSTNEVLSRADQPYLAIRINTDISDPRSYPFERNIQRLRVLIYDNDILVDQRFFSEQEIERDLTTHKNNGELLLKYPNPLPRSTRLRIVVVANEPRFPNTDRRWTATNKGFIWELDNLSTRADLLDKNFDMDDCFKKGRLNESLLFSYNKTEMEGQVPASSVPATGETDEFSWTERRQVIDGERVIVKDIDLTRIVSRYDFYVVKGKGDWSGQARIELLRHEKVQNSVATPKYTPLILGNLARRGKIHALTDRPNFYEVGWSVNRFTSDWIRAVSFEKACSIGTPETSIIIQGAGHDTSLITSVYLPEFVSTDTSPSEKQQISLSAHEVQVYLPSGEPTLGYDRRNNLNTKQFTIYLKPDILDGEVDYTPPLRYNGKEYISLVRRNIIHNVYIVFNQSREIEVSYDFMDWDRGDDFRIYEKEVE